MVDHRPWYCVTLALVFLTALSSGNVHPARAQGEAARIVSIGGAVTEILYELGEAERVVAVDTTSVRPPEALATKPNVGYLRQLSAEGVLSMRPTLVLAIADAGPPDALKLVAEAGVPVRVVPNDPTADGVENRIRAVAEAVGRVDRGQNLSRDAADRFAALDAVRRRIDHPVRALFILSLQNGRIMVGGRGTTADGIMALAGAENAAEGVEGYKPMTSEAIVAARPDAVVMMSVGPGGAPPADLFADAALSQTPAGRDGRLVAMDGTYLLGFGPRTPEAARELMLALYPALQSP